VDLGSILNEWVEWVREWVDLDCVSSV
jgi:hypothetical protein